MRILLLALPAICLALAACDPAPQSATRMAEPTEHAVSVTDAWIRLPAVGGRPASGYFTAAAGAMPEAIVNVTSPSPGRLEMHESMSDGGMSSMRQIETVPFEAGEPLMRSEEHTSELQSLMRISYAVFCLKKKTETKHKY